MMLQSVCVAGKTWHSDVATAIVERSASDPFDCAPGNQGKLIDATGLTRILLQLSDAIRDPRIAIPGEPKS